MRVIKSGLVELDQGWGGKEEKLIFGESRRMGIRLSLCCEHEKVFWRKRKDKISGDLEISGKVDTRFASEDFPYGPVVRIPRFHHMGFDSWQGN